MPGFNGTGPQGAGPMTGGARGYCVSAGGYNPGFAGGSGGSRGSGYGAGFGRGPGFRRGLGPGMGMGRGFGHGRGYGWYPPAYGATYPLEPADETNALKAEADYLKNSLDAITKRLEELEKNAS